MSETKNLPKDTPFRQQTLQGYQPIYTARLVSIIFFISAILFFAFGFPLYVSSERVVEVTKRYDDDCKESKQNCKITINIDKKIPEPVYVYYKLENFYQNHRLYVRSRSYAQLRNGKPTDTELNLCSPAKYNKDFKGYYKPTDSKELKDDDVAVPCGMVARSVFNDTYSISGYDIEFDDLVYESDKNIWINGDESKQWHKINDALRIWMKISPFSTFRKLYGVVKSDIKKGKLELEIDNNYNVDDWDGKKFIVLSSASVFGGKNNKLGIIFISAGCVCVLCALIFMAMGWLVSSKSSESLSAEDLKKLKF